MNNRLTKPVRITFGGILAGEKVVMSSKPPGAMAPGLKHWILKGCRRCRGDMFLDGDTWHCLSCGWSPSDEHSGARYRLGRKALPITVRNIYDALQSTKSIESAADILHCSRGYIYQELKKRGRTPKEVISES